MGKVRRSLRSSSRERSRSPKISKKGLQDQINLMAKSIAELVEAQKLAIKATTISTETQKVTDVCDKNNPELPHTTDAPVLVAEPNDNKSMETESPLEDGEGEGECPDLDLDEELLEVLGEEVPVAISKVKINEKLKSWWKTWMEKGLSEETRKELLKKYPRDGEFITEAPKINLEVQRHLSEIAKKRDGHFLLTQNCVGTAISSLSGAVSMLTEASKEPIDQTLLLKHLWDTGKILADVFNQQSVARKSFITPTLDKDIKPTLDASVSDEWLYGQKLTEQVKEAKAIVKAAATLKTQDRPVAKKPFNRFFNQGNARGPPLRHRQVGYYNPRRFTNANYRHRAPTASARTVHKTSSTERTQTSKKK